MRVVHRADAVRVRDHDGPLEEARLLDPGRPRHLAGAVQREPAGEDGVVVRRLAARHDRGDARAHGALADLELARAADDRAVPDRHPAHVGDGVDRARRPVERNAEVAGARLVGGASGRGREETHGEECRHASFHARESTAGGVSSANFAVPSARRFSPSGRCGRQIAVTSVGIYGFGRIGRNLFRLLHAREDIRIGAISDLARAGRPRLPAALRHAARPLPRGGVASRTASSTSAARRIPLLSGKDQPAVPRWGDLGVHTVLEATSRGRTRAEVEAHLAAGAQRVILLAPAARDARRHGRHGRQRRRRSRPSTASSPTPPRPCTASTPVLKILARARSASGARSSRPSTPTRAHHRLADVPAEDMRRGRAAAENIIPQASRSPRDGARTCCPSSPASSRATR